MDRSPKLRLARGIGRIAKQGGRVQYTVPGSEREIRRLISQADYTKKRPLLLTDAPIDVLTRLMEVRKPYYEELANIIVDTGEQRVKSTVVNIKKRLLEHNFSPLKK